MATFHFFACRNSLPSIINRLLPERIGDMLLKLLKNRNLDDSPKYKAFYHKTTGQTAAQISFFTKLGYKIVRYDSFVGHKYFHKIPIINGLEKLYTKLLFKFKFHHFSKVALVVLKKKSSVEHQK